MQDKMYIYGGNHNGRYLNDLNVSKYYIHSVEYLWNLHLLMDLVL